MAHIWPMATVVDPWFKFLIPHRGWRNVLNLTKGKCWQWETPQNNPITSKMNGKKNRWRGEPLD